MPTPGARGPTASLAAQGEELKKNLKKPLTVGSRRIALERKITLDFPHFQGFLTEYSSNLSMTGMFVKSSRPEAPGTVVAFEFRLADGLNLIRGQAEVIWRRARAEGDDRPAGMGLRFVRLDKESRRLIRWAVEKQLRDGGESPPLDVSPVVSRGEETSSIEELALVHPGSEEEARRSKLHPYAGAAVAKSGHERWRPILFAGAGLVAAGLLFYLLARDGGPAPAPRPEPPVATDAAASPPVATDPVLGGAAVPGASDPGVPDPAVPAPAVPAPADSDPADSAPADSAPADSAPADSAPADSDPAASAPIASEPLGEEATKDLTEILVVVEAWAQAWSQQRADDYLAFYAADFSPPRGLSRSDWSDQRRDRITRPQRIEVRITDLDAEWLGPSRARASFLQFYASDNYRDITRKTLHLVMEEGRWKISEEQSGP